eukprot:7681968-Alexandrium_andersonii.AAC.1
MQKTTSCNAFSCPTWSNASRKNPATCSGGFLKAPQPKAPGPRRDLAGTSPVPRRCLAGTSP